MKGSLHTDELIAVVRCEPDAAGVRGEGICCGRRLNKQIAYTLGIVERTVKAHRGRVMQKTGVASLADLVRAAERLGLGSR
jgi:hypothetical protein